MMAPELLSNANGGYAAKKCDNLAKQNNKSDGNASTPQWLCKVQNHLNGQQDITSSKGYSTIDRAIHPITAHYLVK